MPHCWSLLLSFWHQKWDAIVASCLVCVSVDLNAVTRSLDLACKILSPAMAGLIMTYASLLVSAIVIAAWNVFSLVAEYSILSHVYRLVPALAYMQTPATGQYLLNK